MNINQKLIFLYEKNTKYEPIEIVQRFRIDDVHAVTSNETQRSQIPFDSRHDCESSYCNANGMTNIATQRSDIANDT